MSTEKVKKINDTTMVGVTEDYFLHVNVECNLDDFDSVKKTHDFLSVLNHDLDNFQQFLNSFIK